MAVTLTTSFIPILQSYLCLPSSLLSIFTVREEKTSCTWNVFFFVYWLELGFDN